MRGMADGSVDAVITDPPYCAGAVSESQRTRAGGQGLRSENLTRFGWFTGDNMGTAGLVWLLRAIAVEAVRVIKPSGSLLVFCDWRMQASLQPAIESAGLRYQNLIVWDKGHMGLGVAFRAQHELVLHFTNGAPAYHARDTGNVIKCSRVTGNNREHQTQKPVELMERLIRVVTPSGGTVLDPFAGSGSTGVACVNTNRHFIGIEREAAYVEIARRRLAEAAAQPRLEGVA
jgi:site-specific DNA-methyltransferase (adenine-specific)